MGTAFEKVPWEIFPSYRPDCLLAFPELLSGASQIPRLGEPESSESPISRTQQVSNQVCRDEDHGAPVQDDVDTQDLGTTLRWTNVRHRRRLCVHSQYSPRDGIPI